MYCAAEKGRRGVNVSAPVRRQVRNAQAFAPLRLGRACAIAERAGSAAAHHVLPTTLAAGGRQDVDNAQDIVVLEVAQDLDLTQQPLAVDRVLKGLWNLLDGHGPVELDVAPRADQAVRALTDSLAHCIVGWGLETHAADGVVLVAVLEHDVFTLDEGPLGARGSGHL